MARPRVIDADAALDAAATTLAARGIAGTTVDDVAAAAGVSRATIYRCLGNKDDIVRAVIERETRSLLDDLSVRIEGADTTGELIRIVVRTAAEGLERNQVLRRLTDEDRRETLPFITVDSAPLIATIVATLGSEVRRGVTFHMPERSLPLALEEATRLFLDHLTTPRLERGRLPPDELADRIATMVEPLLHAI